MFFSIFFGNLGPCYYQKQWYIKSVPQLYCLFTMANVTLCYHGKCYQVLPWYLGKWEHVVGVASITMVIPGNAKCSQFPSGL